MDRATRDPGSALSLWLSRRSYLRRAPFQIVLAAAGVYAFVFVLLQFRMYEAFRMGLRDLAFFQQALDSTLQGNPFVIRQGYPPDTSVSHLFYAGWEERSLFSEHLYLLLGIFLPFYTLTRTPHGFFVVNALMVAGAAVPLYLLARRVLRHDWLAAAVALLYLLHPAVQAATLGDWVYGFHPDNVAPLCLFGMLYFASAHRPRGFWAMALLAMASVESLALPVGAAGLFVMLTQRGFRRHGAAVLSVATVYFAFATLAVIPLAGGGRSPYYFAALRSLLPAVQHPELLEPLGRAVYDLAAPLLAPLALLPLLGGAVWLIVLPSLFNGIAAQTVGYPIPMEYGSWHVWAYAVAAFAALTRALAGLRRRLGPRAARAVVPVLFGTTALGLLWWGPYPFSHNVWPLVYDLDPVRQSAIARAKAEVPYTASLSVEFFAGSHFAGRPYVRWFPLEWRSADYVLVDSVPWAWWSDENTRMLTRAQRSGTLELRWQKGTVYLFQRKPGPPMQRSLDASFANGIDLEGFALEQDSVPAGESVNLTLFWRARERVGLNLTVFIHVQARDGRTIAQRDNQPDNGTYPTGEWATGNTVVDRYRIRIAENVPEGVYTLVAGMYDPASGQRVRLADGSDHVVVTPITISRR